MLQTHLQPQAAQPQPTHPEPLRVGAGTVGRAAELLARAQFRGAKAQAEAMRKGDGDETGRTAFFQAQAEYLSVCVTMLVNEIQLDREASAPRPQRGHHIVAADVGGLPVVLEYSAGEDGCCIEAVWVHGRAYTGLLEAEFSASRCAAWQQRVEQHRADELRADAEAAGTPDTGAVLVGGVVFSAAQRDTLARAAA